MLRLPLSVGVLFGVLYVCIASAYGAGAEDLPSASECLERLAASSRWVTHSAMVLRVDADGATSVVRRYQDGERLRISKRNASGTELNLLATPEFHATWTTGVGVQYTNAAGVMRARKDFAQAMPEFGSFLDGVLPQYQTHEPGKWDLAKRFGAVQKDTIADLECLLIESIGQDLRIRLWVAPTRGFNLAKCIVDDTSSPDLGRQEITIDDITYSQVGDRWIVSRGSFEFRNTPAGEDRVRVVHVKAVREEVDLSPDFQGSDHFDVTAIPEGAPTTVLTDEASTGEPFRYIWKSGKPVLDYDADLVDRVRNQVRTRKPSFNNLGEP